VPGAPTEADGSLNKLMATEGAHDSSCDSTPNTNWGARLCAPPLLQLLLTRLLLPHLPEFACDWGITRLCDHTYLIRPLAMNCDPPTIACSECATTGAVAPIGTVDFLWDNQCDRCGAYETLLTPTLFRLRHTTISGHVCRRCADEDQDHASKPAERVVLLDRQPRHQPKRIPR
jgi:hypothetical protein